MSGVREVGGGARKGRRGDAEVGRKGRKGKAADEKREGGRRNGRKRLDGKIG